MLFLCTLRSQDVELPADFRQHSLMEYNSSFFNPAFSLFGNNPQSVAFWGRWQWQSIDTDPTTYFLNYTRKINAVSAFSVGFFQHNTAVFLNTGGVANYAYAYRLNERAQLALGVNVYGYTRELADDRFVQDPILPLPGETTDFILQVAPGLLFKYDNWDFGLAWENLLDYNFTTSEKVSGAGEKVFLGSVGVVVPVSAFGFTEDTYVKPLLYYKTIPNLDNQVGLNALFSTPKFWLQGGYNNFYGISAGFGGRFFNKLSVGLLWEFGTSSDLSGRGSTVEVVTAFFIGPQYFKVQEILPEEEEIPEEPEELITEAEPKEDAEAEALAAQQAEEARKLEEEERLAQVAREEQLKDSLNEVRLAEVAAAERARVERVRDSIIAVRQAEVAAAKKAREEFVRDSVNAVRMAQVEAARRAREEFVTDSLNRVKIAQAEAERQARQEFIRDSLQALKLAREEEERLARAAFVKDSTERARIALAEEAKRIAEADTAVQQEEVTPQKGEKYQEVDSADGLQPGFYLIANVFGTKRYYESFMKDLTERGLEPKSFYRSEKKFNYVYLQRYNTVQEARRARDSKFNGRYQGDTWIFRVVGN